MFLATMPPSDSDFLPSADDRSQNHDSQESDLSISAPRNLVRPSTYPKRSVKKIRVFEDDDDDGSDGNGYHGNVAFHESLSDGEEPKFISADTEHHSRPAYGAENTLRDSVEIAHDVDNVNNEEDYDADETDVEDWSVLEPKIESHAKVELDEKLDSNNDEDIVLVHEKHDDHKLSKPSISDSQQIQATIPSTYDEENESQQDNIPINSQFSNIQISQEANIIQNIIISGNFSDALIETIREHGAKANCKTAFSKIVPVSENIIDLDSQDGGPIIPVKKKLDKTKLTTKHHHASADSSIINVTQINRKEELTTDLNEILGNSTDIDIYQEKETLPPSSSSKDTTLKADTSMADETVATSLFMEENNELVQIDHKNLLEPLNEKMLNNDYFSKIQMTKYQKTSKASFAAEPKLTSETEVFTAAGDFELKSRPSALQSSSKTGEAINIDFHLKHKNRLEEVTSESKTDINTNICSKLKSRRASAACEYVPPKRRKRPSLAELCAKSAPSRVRYRVGLSKKDSVEHLHSYLPD